MPTRTETFGPGTLYFGSPEPGELEFACQVTSVTLGHEYEEVTEATTTLGGCEVPASTNRSDTLTASTLIDLTASGFYNYLWQNDLATKPVFYKPNEGEAEWAANAQLRLPTEVVGEEFGANLTGDLELPLTDLTFTPAADPAGA